MGGDDRKHLVDDLDDLLDAALARHRDIEPRPGFEERVLARLRAEPQPAPWAGRTWLLAAGLTGLAIVLATAHWARRLALVPARPARSAASLSTPSRRPEKSEARTTRQAASRRQEPEPRQETFPSPAPLSNEERLLMAYVKLGPPPGSGESRAGSESSSESKNDEIIIEPLEIAPLRTPSIQFGNEIN